MIALKTGHTRTDIPEQMRLSGYRRLKSPTVLSSSRSGMPRQARPFRYNGTHVVPIRIKLDTHASPVSVAWNRPTKTNPHVQVYWCVATLRKS